MKKNAFTIDVEDVINITMFDMFGIEKPPFPSVVSDTNRILEILDEKQVKATFFVLGEVAQYFPELIRKIAEEDHELGVHGYRHLQYFRLSREQAFNDLDKSKKLIEDISNKAVIGHRAPAFSIRPDTAWMLDVLVEVGFRYDSSIMPCKAKRYGWPNTSKDIHTKDVNLDKSIIEAPMSTINILRKDMPACGGGYLRHFPSCYTQWSFRQIEKKRPVILYVHPYEIGTMPVPSELQKLLGKTDLKKKLTAWLRWRNRTGMEKKIKRLLTKHKFTTLKELIFEKQKKAATPSQPPK